MDILSEQDKGFHPLRNYREYTQEDMIQRASLFFESLKGRRSVRSFSDRTIPMEVIENCIKTASTAPSGANRQPWHFVAVFDREVKKKIREAAEEGEREFYRKQAEQTWGKALKHLGTNASKPFLETAPCLIAIFAQPYSLSPEGEKIPHYYVTQSVGIAAGMLITAVHNAGLVSLTYTPSDPRFLNELLGRPSYEQPFMILVTGYPDEEARVPVISKKSLEEISTFI